MKLVEQEVFEDGHGDCVAACLASLLEVSIDQVPNYHTDQSGHQIAKFNLWLAQKNLRLVWVHRHGEHTLGGYAIAIAWSPRLQGHSHAVVWSASAGEVVWDPHPKREMGIGPLLEFYVLQVLDPSYPIG